MSLSRGHSTASSLTSSETAIILSEWAGWVIPSIKFSYFGGAIPGLIGTYCVMWKGLLKCPSEGFLDNSPVAQIYARLVHLKGFSCEVHQRENYWEKKLHFFFFLLKCIKSVYAELFNEGHNTHRLWPKQRNFCVNFLIISGSSHLLQQKHPIFLL